jgi:hypothetical protein
MKILLLDTKYIIDFQLSAALPGEQIGYSQTRMLHINPSAHPSYSSLTSDKILFGTNKKNTL